MVAGALERRRSSGWTITAASAVGARHLARGRPCEDAFGHARWTEFGDADVALLAVADGAGSLAGAAEAATLAVGLTVECAERRLQRGLPTDGREWRRFLEALQDDIAERFRDSARVREAGTATGRLGTTLVVALLSDRWVGVVAIGDSFAVLRLADGSLHAPLLPTHANDVVTGTELLSSTGRTDVRRAARIFVVEESSVDAVVLISDGVERALIQRGEVDVVHAPFLDPIIDEARTPGGASEGLATFLLTDPDLTSTTDDDRTMVLAVRQ